MSNTYSFLDVQGSITGPGISSPVGSSAGVAEEGITIEWIDDKDLLTVGSDGKIMHSLRAGQAARATIRLLKTSEINARLSAAFNFQKSSSANWGKNVMVFSNLVQGDVLTGSEIAFAKHPSVVYAKDAGMMEWSFLGNFEALLGAGVPDVNV